MTGILWIKDIEYSFSCVPVDTYASGAILYKVSFHNTEGETLFEFHHAGFGDWETLPEIFMFASMHANRLGL